MAKISVQSDVNTLQASILDFERLFFVAKLLINSLFFAHIDQLACTIEQILMINNIDDENMTNVMRRMYRALRRDRLSGNPVISKEIADAYDEFLKLNYDNVFPESDLFSLSQISRQTFHRSST